ncbi:hypothetical protein Vadar_008969 [Vaccinium darrowii]|uniref:Uncharacterized protein n=1 Tax=Vaccinium darrowii TaxID=229202 RepID=A0ACB7YKH6_9ERIC|nr:hypothetical protein Vadar_008969 [Vaccinium darrowii]
MFFCFSIFDRSSSMDLIEQELDRLRSPDPGPRDLSVLPLQDRHRSKRIWDLDMEPPNDSAKVSFRQVEAELRKNATPCEEIMVYIRKANLEGLLHVPFVTLDRGLITALVERWHPETHSFHLRPREMTVTLQDVEVILAQFDGQIKEGGGEEVVKQKARGFLVRMLGGTIFADHTGTLVNLCWLPLLEDFEKAGRYCWGSGTLGALYNGLCRVATKGKEAMGAMILLQIWAWERLPMLSPARLGKRSPHPGTPLVGK